MKEWQLLMNNKSVISNMIWRFFERFGAQGVTVIVSVILARVLEPSTYSTIALVTVIMSILQVFLDTGFSQALIWKKDADDVDFSSVFYFNVAFGIVLYLLLFFAAPLIARFYQRTELVSIIRVLGLSLIIFSLKNVQQAYVAKNMMFRKFFFATLGGTLGASVIGIFLAFSGYGVWALVSQYLFNMFVDTIVLWFTVKWRPKAVFSWHRLRFLMSYGWKLFISSLLDTVYSNVRQLIIGKIYTPDDLAYYNQGKKYTQTIVDNVSLSVDSVLMPAMSEVQNSKEAVRNIARRAIRIGTYVFLPIMLGMCACADSLVNLIFTAKWLPAVPYFRIFCIVFALYPLHTANLNAIKSLGYSNIFLKLEVFKKAVGIVSIAATVKFGPFAMACGMLFDAFAAQYINSYPNKKLIDYGYFEQLKDILPNIVLSSVMAGIVYSVKFIGLSDYITLPIQIVLGVLIYVAGSAIFKMDSFEYIIETLKRFIGKNTKN